MTLAHRHTPAATRANTRIRAAAAARAIAAAHIEASLADVAVWRGKYAYACTALDRALDTYLETQAPRA